MKPRALLLLSTVTASLVIAACATGDDDDAAASPTPSPSGTALKTFTFTGIDFDVHAPNRALVRVLDGTTVVFCDSSSNIVAGNAFVVGAPGPFLEVGRPYTVEMFADMGAANDVYEEGGVDDHNWAFDIAPVTTNVQMSFVHFSVAQIPITWTLGANCPGTP